MGNFVPLQPVWSLSVKQPLQHSAQISMNNLEAYARAFFTEKYFVHNLVSHTNRVQEVARVSYLLFFSFQLSKSGKWPNMIQFPSLELDSVMRHWVWWSVSTSVCVVFSHQRRQLKKRSWCTPSGHRPLSWITSVIQTTTVGVNVCPYQRQRRRWNSKHSLWPLTSSPSTLQVQYFCVIFLKHFWQLLKFVFILYYNVWV